nr:hypothetical protein GCM10020241_66620 [Streptoalloteichus tenebrarius]
MKIAALYWPRIVRLVPDGYPTRDSDTVRALADEVVLRRSPESSVDAVAPVFLDLVNRHADQLRPSLGLRHPNAPGTADGPSFAWVHASQIAPAVRQALHDAGLALAPDNPHAAQSVPSQSGYQPQQHTQNSVWVAMSPRLAAVYMSVLAEDFATANRLQPTTDQDHAYAVVNHWTADSIAATVLDRAAEPPPATEEDLAERLGFLALSLVVPANLDAVPAERVLAIRRRHGAEFLAFGQAVDQTVEALSTDLAGIRDQAVLEEYLHDVVEARFVQPLDELRRTLRRLTGEAVTTSINVKTELPAGLTLAGGAWLSGHPVLAGSAAAAIGLMGVRRGLRQQRESARQASPAASFLLHTASDLPPRRLLGRTLARLGRVAGLV